ncbi:MAG: ABC transporter permease [Alistipes sp.]|nr:ABC transporter permease [Alistipes sp.]
MKSLARHIALRGTSSKNMMVHIATSAVAVSIAVVIISLSVIFGFKEQISALVSGTVADITISSPYGKRQPELHPINDNESLLNILFSTGNIAHTERYAVRSCVVRGEEGAMGIALKGIGAEADTEIFAERMVEGALPRIEEARRKEILLSQSVAEKIGAKCNGRVELLLLEGDTPRREVFKVCGIYRSALGETGAELALSDIRNVQKLNGWEPSQISGYACRLYDTDLSDQSTDIINLRLMHEYEGEENLAAVSSREEHADIFGWLETHDVNATVILTIMLVVAIFNMVTALLILVLERTRMVGTLLSLGMQQSTIRRIFTYRAAQIIAVGMIIGNALAIALLLLQQHFHLVKLDETGYFLAEVPVSLEWGWMVAINILFATIIIVITHLATAIVGRIKVADAIKYN